MKTNLRQLALRFDPHVYENILLAYIVSTGYGDVNKLIQSEFMHSISRMIKESLQIASKRYLESVQDLLKAVNNKEFIEAIRLILKSFTDLMYNHHLISRWHEEKDFVLTKESITDPDQLKDTISFYSEVRRDLLRNRKHIWAKMQEKLTGLLENFQIYQLKLTELYQVLKWLGILTGIGEDFSGVEATLLNKVLSLIHF